MTFDEEMDAYDPLIAERFELLNRAVPIDMATEAVAEQQVVSQISEPTLLAPRSNSFTETASRPMYLLAAAAAMVIVVGGAVFAATSLGDDPDLQAGDGGFSQSEISDRSADADDGSDDLAGSETSDDPNKSLTVEVPQSTTSAPVGEDATETPDSSNQAASSATQPSGQGESAQESGSAGSVGVNGPTETTDPPTEPATTAAPATTAVPTTEPPQTTAPAPTTDPGPESSWLNPPSAEKMITVRGKVTEVFTDCQSRLILNDQDEVESVGPISCDGGSYIIVSGTRIQTASGYMMSEADMYGKHVATLRPGQTVSVTAVHTESAGGMLTLNCVLCEINVGG